MDCNCQYANRCWRLSYSKKLLEDGWLGDPPTQLDLVLSGHATMEMTQRGKESKDKSVYAELMPRMEEGSPIYLCPAIEGKTTSCCIEHTKETQRLKKKQESRKRQEAYYEEKLGKKRVWIPQETRRQVAAKCGYKCYYCKRNIQTLKALGVKTNVDHLIPLSKGGNPTDESNLVLACFKCNNAKGKEIWQEGQRVGFYD